MIREKKRQSELYSGTFANLKAAQFNKGTVGSIERIDIPIDSQGSFFYPKYHFGYFRYCWGNPFTFWDRGTSFFDEILDNVYSKFRAGSTISIYFIFGLAVPITGSTNNFLNLSAAAAQVFFEILLILLFIYLAFYKQIISGAKYNTIKILLMIWLMLFWGRYSLSNK